MLLRRTGRGDGRRSRVTASSFELPAAGLATAIAVFGITGVGATELVMYPYWCIEKGYARFVGPRDGSRAWVARARGWIRVMHLDIFCSLVIYTMATVAFYLLGAGVLHRMGVVPAATTPSRSSRRSTRRHSANGRSGSSIVGAVVTLYGTIFASTAAHSRSVADVVRMVGGYSVRTGRAGGAGATGSSSSWRASLRSSTGFSRRRCRWSSLAESRRRCCCR